MIKTTTDADAASAIDAIVLGFCDDPILRWMFPEPQDYLSRFPTVMRLFGGGAFQHRSAYHIDGFAGAALWLPPGIHPDGDGLVALFQENFDGAMLEEIFSLFEQMDGFHPGGEFWHLAFIAVDPVQRGRGLGSDLLSHTLKSVDTDNKLAYLESTNPKNLSLYRRHGFELIGNIQAGSSPPLFPMIREPQ